MRRAALLAALRYLLRGWDVSRADCKHVSLLLRQQMLELAQRDLGVVRYVSEVPLLPPPRPAPPRPAPPRPRACSRPY